MPGHSNITGTARAYDKTVPIPAERDFLRALARNKTLQAAVTLALLLNIFFFPFIWGKKTLTLSSRGAPTIMPGGAAGDAPMPKLNRAVDMAAPAWELEPWVPILGRIYLNERAAPLWNPYAGYGTPFAAAMQPECFYPLTALLSLHPTPEMFALFLTLRLWIAGFFTYLFLKLFVQQSAALAGGIAFMFTGYLILFLNMPHLSVEILLPAVFYGFELLHRSFNRRVLFLNSAVVLFSLLGGMPESAFLSLIFGYSYYLFRAITDRTGGTLTRQLARLALANVFGFGMAAILLLPFLEFASHSFSLHTADATPGLESLTGIRQLLGYLAPLIQGGPAGNIFPGANGIEGYFGVITGLMAVLAVVGWIADRKSGSTGSERWMIPFFAVAAAVMILKRYGVSVVQWIGYLPGFRRAVLYKYLEPSIGFSMAVLCAVGVSRLVGGKYRPRHIGIAIGAVLCAFLLAYEAYLPEAVKLDRNAHMFFESSTQALIVLIVLSAVLFLTVAEDGKVDHKRGFQVVLRNGTILLCCLAGELFVIFIYPVFYKDSEQPDKNVNAFAGAPYISWLQQKDLKSFRVFGREGYLYPNWAGVFGIFDIRSVDAMYNGKYMPFVRNFFAKSETAGVWELHLLFTGGTPDAPSYSFTSPIARRLLQLSSVRYFITKTPLHADGLAAGFLESDKHTVPTAEVPLGEASWNINGVTKSVLFQHAPSSPKALRARIEPGRAELSFSLGMDPSGYGGSCGDGADFMVDVRGANGSVKRVFHGFINPYGNPADRHWFDEKVDLNAYIGQDVDLMLSTGPGPKGDNCRDWAGWGDLRLGKSAFDLVYDKEVQIYEYSSILPRAAMFYGAETAATDEDALRRLVDPGFNVLQRAVVASEGLSPEAARELQQMATAPPSSAAAARIVQMKSREVDIDAAPDRRALLVLNDTDYPGWRAYIDGKESPILSANYLFRGVLLDAGRHHVVFRYEPASFHAGVAISLLAVLGLVVTARFSNRLYLD